MQGWHQPKYYYFRSHCDQNCENNSYGEVTKI